MTRNPKWNKAGLMRGSWRIARLAGIDLSIHWTFGLLMGWILYAAMSGIGGYQGIIEVAFVIALFGCVVLHELGHATAARLFGIPTHGITLLPIGGVAQLDRIPRDPRQECVIALAGPAVNVLIVAMLLPIVALLYGGGAWGSPLSFGTSFLVRLIGFNVMLVFFNMIPAFPMDGGRILRAFLAGRTDYVTATRNAKLVGQGIALLLAVWGLSANPMLLLIAAFVFFAAEAEYGAVRCEAEATRRSHRPQWLDHANDHSLLARFEGMTGRDERPLAAKQHGPAHAPVSVHQVLPGGVVIIRTFPRGLRASEVRCGESA